MEVICSPRRIQTLALKWKARGRRIAFVPTMGFLHEGHLSLLRVARAAADVVVVSIFVNPAQFGPKEDFNKYPRDLEGDLVLCRKEKVDVVFAPARKDIYPPGFSTYVEENDLSRDLCGAARLGHFRGVATVVAKLFNLVQPDLAFFGAKDFQQSRVVIRMVRDLNFPVKIEVMPTVREKDGLALSSRNRSLKGEARRQARCLYRSLVLARKLVGEGKRLTGEIKTAMERVIKDQPLARIDYIEIFDTETLRPQRRVNRRSVAALAVFVDKTRLIDNLSIWPGRLSLKPSPEGGGPSRPLRGGC